MRDRLGCKLEGWQPALTAMALGALMLTWAWAAEAHEPSRAGGAPGALAVSAFATPAVGMAPDVGVSSESGEAAAGVGVTSAYASEQTVVRRPWVRGGSPQPVPVYAVRMPPPEPMGWLTLRAGWFDTDAIEDNDFVAGFKVTGRAGKALQLGVSTDWQYRSESAYERVDRYIDPSGNPVDVVASGYESHSHLFPILAVVEVRPAPGDVQPYLGVGVGYEALVVEVRDYQLGIEYDDEFGGFGWQPYGGVSMTLGRNLQFTAEAYGNLSTVERTVQDYETGYLVEQRIDLDGFGLRAGLAVGF